MRTTRRFEVDRPERRGRGLGLGRRTIGLGGLILLILAGLQASIAWAEPQKVEVVGSYPIREALRGRVKPRDEAIQRALWEAVGQVASDLVGDADLPDEAAAPTPAPAAGRGSAVAEQPAQRFRKALGQQVLPYTKSFRIIEDQGERPILFAEEPGIRSEYLVVVAVVVDADRVEQELVRAGLVAARPRLGGATREPILVELVGIERHAGLRQVVELLRRPLAATRVETLEFARAHQLLRVAGPWEPQELAERLASSASSELLLEPVAVDREARRVRIQAQWRAPLPVEAPPGETGTAGAGGPASATRPAGPGAIPR